MKKLLKKALQAVLPPSAFASLTAISARRWIQRTERQMGLDQLTRDYVAGHGRTVLQGPFRGMRYTPLTDNRHVGARLIGCYEQELSSVVEQYCQSPCKRVIDVGCAEGYYAVGFALRLPAAEIVAFDTDPWARNACRQLAALNGVSDRVQVRGYCSPQRLGEVIGNEKCLILSDCEGFETILLDPVLIPSLARCDLLVEIHSGEPSPDHPLVEKFRATHRIEYVRSEPRTGNEAGELRGFPIEARQQLMDELRQPWQGWIVFRAD